MDYKDPKKARDEVFGIATKIDDFLMDLEQEHHRIAEWEKADNACSPYPMDDFGYAEAILHWESNGRHPDAIFSCQDPWLILYRRELSEKFGLPCLTAEEAEAHKRATLNVHFEPVIATGDPISTPEYNRGEGLDMALNEIAKIEQEMQERFPHLWISKGGDA